MSQKKKKVALLDKSIMEDVKGGIPYEDPGLIPLDLPVVVPPGEPVIPGDPGDPVTVASCTSGPSNVFGNCISGYHNNRGTCNNGSGNYNSSCNNGPIVVQGP